MNFELARFNMIEQQIRPWNMFDEKVLGLLKTIKREEFVNQSLRNLALSDIELPLPGEQKMLFPRIEARLLQELKLRKKDKVLEIGTGSGYVTALLAKLTDFVYSLEINEQNKQFAVDNLTRAGIKNVSIIEADGMVGLAAKAPFDKIFVGGALAEITPELKAQLKVGGILVGIEGVAPIMHAVVIEKISENEYKQTQLFETYVEPLSSAAPRGFKF
ncbi:MAG: protein-L-isoaspartate O-methyltransferase [Neisseriaceae bacterium]|nr:MAG: protein-L-isoaspartate O-methyltransferase [Neisseriaceae bacterium]